MNRALHTDLEPLETICRHYREAHGSEMLALLRKLVGALIKGVHELLQRNHFKSQTIIRLTERLVATQWQLFLLRGWRREREPLCSTQMRISR